MESDSALCYTAQSLVGLNFAFSGLFLPVKDMSNTNSYVGELNKSKPTFLLYFIRVVSKKFRLHAEGNGEKSTFSNLKLKNILENLIICKIVLDC